MKNNKYLKTKREIKTKRFWYLLSLLVGIFLLGRASVDFNLLGILMSFILIIPGFFVDKLNIDLECGRYKNA